MKRFFILWIGFVAICLMLGAAPVRGGEIRLKNGDRLTGSLVGFAEGKLVYRTDYAGEIRVDGSQVSCISTEQAHRFLFPDEVAYHGTAECPEPGVLQIRDPESGAAGRFPLADLRGVNPPPALRYKVNISAGGSASTGNTDSQALYGTGDLEVRSERHRVTLNGRGNYAESDDTLTARNAAAFGKYDYFLTKKLFAYGQTLLEEDRLQDLNLRATLGAGLGYQFFDAETLGLYAEAGPSYVAENYENTPGRSYASGRWSVRFDWQIVPDRIRFFHLHEGYVSAEDTGDFYLRSEQGFRLPLIEKFFFNIQMDYDYKNKPPPGKKNADLRYLLGLGYAFSN